MTSHSSRGDVDPGVIRPPVLRERGPAVPQIPPSQRSVSKAPGRGPFRGRRPGGRLGALFMLLAACIPNIPRGTAPAEQARDLPRVVSMLAPDAADVYFTASVLAGSAWDPPGQEGLSAWTARSMVEAGAGDRDPAALREALYLTGNTVEVLPDKDQVTFRLRCHRDQAEVCAELLADVVTRPRFEPGEVARVKDEARYAVGEGAGDDEEALGYEVLDTWLYEGRPYGHPATGRQGALDGLDVGEPVRFWADHYLRAATVIGVSGAADAALVDRFARRFEGLGHAVPTPTPLLRAPVSTGRALLLVETGGSGVGFRLGHTLSIDRDDPDYPALVLAFTALGAHRQSFGLLFRELRASRGLNYGTYAYFEPFRERGDAALPEQGTLRRQGLLHLWVRPTTAENAPFALKLAIDELERFVKDGLDQEALDDVRSYVRGALPLWAADPGRRLAYAVEAVAADEPDALVRLADSIDAVTPEQVRAALQRHVRLADLQIVAVGGGLDAVAERVGAVSPITYQAATPDAAQAARDAAVAGKELEIGAVHRVGVGEVFR
jgi:zinc protease